ncbi:carbon storage regulator CsrA [Salinispira pacifica]|uniref:Translational regulator CsrA n=1 Tax=Salinispira pacifica TaxID=1307761 RepID=V5WFP3_9SPIO|nr:carbon storage regulator CsrA [Salinispira pacifica]AHC14632.1 Carbon storage regulator [Salinispira pacifica]
MLVLTRKINEAIMIGDDIEIAVVDIKGDQVKLGIRAPRSVKVFRHEVYEAIQDENRRAAESSGDLPSLGDFPPKKD